MTDQTPPPDRESPKTATAKPWTRVTQGLAQRLAFRPDWHPALRWWLVPLVGATALGALAVGMAMAHIIDDDVDYGPGTIVAGQSRAIAIASRLAFREVDQHKWVANDPIFQPSAWLDDMPNFQQGIVAALARYASAMSSLSDHGQGPAPELEHAAGLLRYPGTVWKFDPSTSWAPTASSEKQYRNAARNLVDYNTRLAGGDNGIEHRTESLHILMTALGKDLAAASAVIDRHLAENHSALFDSTADDVFYMTKGKVYAYALLLREIGADYAQVLTEHDQAAAWRQMVDALKAAATLDPLVVLNGAPDGTLVPSHLTAQGFYLLRARTQLADIAEYLAR